MDRYLKLPAAELEKRGINVRAVERGGLATYHGPGQLVCYPIIKLPTAENIVKATKQFSDAIKRVAYATIAEYLPVSDLTISPGGKSGVWYKDKKLASSGVVVDQSWVGWHGVAINANPDLSHFSYIDPCGLPSGVMASLQAVLGREVDMGELKQHFVRHFADEFKLEPRYVSPDTILANQTTKA